MSLLWPAAGVKLTHDKMNKFRCSAPDFLFNPHFSNLILLHYILQDSDYFIALIHLIHRLLLTIFFSDVNISYLKKCKIMHQILRESSCLEPEFFKGTG